MHLTGHQQRHTLIPQGHVSHACALLVSCNEQVVQQVLRMSLSPCMTASRNEQREQQNVGHRYSVMPQAASIKVWEHPALPCISIKVFGCVLLSAQRSSNEKLIICKTYIPRAH